MTWVTWADVNSIYTNNSCESISRCAVKAEAARYSRCVSTWTTAARLHAHAHTRLWSPWRPVVKVNRGSVLLMNGAVFEPLQSHTHTQTVHSSPNRAQHSLRAQTQQTHLLTEQTSSSRHQSVWERMSLITHTHTHTMKIWAHRSQHHDDTDVTCDSSSFLFPCQFSKSKLSRTGWVIFRRHKKIILSVKLQYSYLCLNFYIYFDGKVKEATEASL